MADQAVVRALGGRSCSSSAGQIALGQEGRPERAVIIAGEYGGDPAMEGVAVADGAGLDVAVAGVLGAPGADDRLG
jgi:hypothetical protein